MISKVDTCRKEAQIIQDHLDKQENAKFGTATVNLISGSKSEAHLRKTVLCSSANVC